MGGSANFIFMCGDFSDSIGLSEFQEAFSSCTGFGLRNALSSLEQIQVLLGIFGLSALGSLGTTNFEENALNGESSRGNAIRGNKTEKL